VKVFRTILFNLCLLGFFTEPAWAASKKEQVAFGVDDFCPYTCLELNRPGFLVEAVRLILERAGSELIVTRGSWTRLQMLSAQGKIDILGPLTPFIIEKMKITATQILGGSFQGGFIVRRDSTWRYDGVQSLDGLKIGGIKDYSYPPNLMEYFKVAQLQSRYVELIGEDANRRLVQMLAKKRIDTIPMLYDVFWYHAMVLKLPADHFKSAGEVMLPPDRNAYRLGVFTVDKKKREALIETLDQGFLNLKKDGTLQKIMANYGLPEQSKGTMTP